MTKEMAVILLGFLNIVVATNLLGVPTSWRMLLLILSGIALVIIGFLLRAQEMVREGKNSPHYPFIENLPAGTAGDDITIAHDSAHEHKEGITSLN
jgi:hypothetical protein